MMIPFDVQCPIPPIVGVPSATTVILSCLEAAAIRVDAIQVALFMLTVIVLLASASVSRESQDSSVRSVKRGIFLWKKNVFVGERVYFLNGPWSVPVIHAHDYSLTVFMSSPILSMKEKEY